MASLFSSDYDEAFFLAKKLKAVDGASLNDRKLKGRTYIRCFTGADTVCWLVKELSLLRLSPATVDNAIEVGNNMIYSGFFIHVDNASMLVNDDQHFYQWTVGFEQKIEREDTLSRGIKKLSTAPKPSLSAFIASGAAAEPIYDNPVPTPDLPITGPGKIVCSGVGTDCPCYSAEKSLPFAFEAVPRKLVLQVLPGWSVKVCMCGQTKNPPYCDGTHRAYNTAHGTKLLPVHVSNNEAKTQEIWLCQCGHSKKRPFCDGTHNRLRPANAPK